MSLYWYALRCKPRKEEIIYRQVHTHGLEVFYPRLRVNPVNPRARKFKPYFPGYLFVKVDIDAVGISTFQWMPHTLGLVRFGDEPAIVPEYLIAEVRRKAEIISDAGGNLFYDLAPGDKIYINNGLFSGYEAIFDTRIPGTERVRVLLLLLNDHRQVQLELNAGNIIRKKNNS